MGMLDCMGIYLYTVRGVGGMSYVLILALRQLQSTWHEKCCINTIGFNLIGLKCCHSNLLCLFLACYFQGEKHLQQEQS